MIPGRGEDEMEEEKEELENLSCCQKILNPKAAIKNRRARKERERKEQQQGQCTCT